VPLVVALGPGELHHPAELIADAFDEGLNPACSRARFGLQEITKGDALVAIAEPGFAGRAQQQWHHHGDEQRDEIFDEQRATRTIRRKLPGCR
jgi:hypothetical protein